MIPNKVTESLSYRLDKLATLIYATEGELEKCFCCKGVVLEIGVDEKLCYCVPDDRKEKRLCYVTPTRATPVIETAIETRIMCAKRLEEFLDMFRAKEVSLCKELEFLDDVTIISGNR